MRFTMISALLRNTALVFSAASVLQAAHPDISNLNECILEVRHAASNSPSVLTFDDYMANYAKLLADLQSATPHLPHVYQEAAAKPFIQFLKNLGKSHFLRVFDGEPRDEKTATLQQIIPDAALAILSYKMAPSQGVNGFEEIVSDLYEGFLSDEARVNKHSDHPIDPPTYGIIPPLVKFGNPDAGPYTWPSDATRQILGMKCGIVSLPPAQLNGGLLAWSALGHETGGHDVTHADEGLLEELAQKVHAAVLQKFHSEALANYWARCIDESSADVCGYLHMGPSLGIGLIGYFRALGDGKLRSIGSTDDPHPIDLLRGYLAAAVAKRLHFQDALAWSQAIVIETRKDNEELYLADAHGHLVAFPASFSQAVASTDVVAQTIMQSPLSALQGHSLQELQDWKDRDQVIVDQLVSILNTDGHLPADLQGPGFYAAYVVAAATQAALQQGAHIPALFNKMQAFLAQMHLENPTWSKIATDKSTALIEHSLKGLREAEHKATPRFVIPKLPQEVR
jgi:hypothetical protein